MISKASYNDRLVKLGLKSLEYKRWKFDLFTLYIIINGIFKVYFGSIFHNKYYLRGNRRKKSKHNFNNSQWQGSFFHRAKTMWNKLPQDVVSCENIFA